MSEEDYQKLLKKNPYLVPKGSEPIHLLNHPSGRSEHDQQVALFTWANQNLDRYPVLRWMFAVPNGGHRHPAVAGKLKAEGVKEQLLWMDYLKSAGYCVRLCYSAKDAQKAIEEYLA
jgi:hypothetical protein